MPWYKNVSNKHIVLSDYFINVKPNEEFYTPYELPESVLVSGHIIKLRDDEINDLKPYTEYVELSPSDIVEIDVSRYRAITILFANSPQDPQNDKITIYENRLWNKGIDLYFGQVFTQEFIQSERKYLSRYVLRANDTNSSTVVIRIDYEI